jgi:hypothetical protein
MLNALRELTVPLADFMSEVHEGHRSGLNTKLDEQRNRAKAAEEKEEETARQLAESEIQRKELEAQLEVYRLSPHTNNTSNYNNP